MASSSTNVDLVISEPMDRSNDEEKVELFYPKVFVEIQGNVSGTPSIVLSLFHATHYAEMTRICDGQQATFKPGKKPWRQTYNPDKASYLVDYVNDSRTWILPSDDSCLPGNLVWFGTTKDKGKIYGPCQFEFNYKRVFEAYQISRGADQKICYKVGGTLIYQLEISHVVIVCCVADGCYQQFPTIEEDKTTKFFTFSTTSVKPRMLINKYQPYDSNNPRSKRHEHVIFAFYLPGDGACLKLANEEGYSELKCISHSYCMKCKGDCEYTVDSKLIDKEMKKWDQFRKNIKY